MVVQLNNYIEQLNQEEYTMHDLDLDLGQEETNDLEGMNLQITMPELVDASMEGLKFYSIKPTGKHTTPSNKCYTYKSFEDLEVGVKVLVSFCQGGSLVHGEVAQAIKGNQRNNLRKNMLEQLTNFKAPTLADMSESKDA